MISVKHIRQTSAAEEHMNTLSHGFGLLLSLFGFILLFTWSDWPIPLAKALILGVFGLSLIALYLASTLYHAEKDADRRRFLKFCDHAAIYLLIAGTYTPMILPGSSVHDGRWMATALWFMAGAGIIAKFFLVGKFRFLSTIIYLFMGWLALFQLELIWALPRPQIALIVAGGLSYTLGTIFYLWHRLPYNHAIWHMFVLGGSTCHYVAVLIYVAAP